MKSSLGLVTLKKLPLSTIRGYATPCARMMSSSYLTYHQSDRSRGFGFIRMSTVEEATKCIAELNGIVRILRMAQILH